jgi:hypothetical protein
MNAIVCTNRRLKLMNAIVFPPIIKGVITVFVFQLLAPWWQSEESNRADSFTRRTFVT